MTQKEMGLLNKNEENKKIMTLVIAIIMVISTVSIILFVNNYKDSDNNKNSIATIQKDKRTVILYIWNSNKKEGKRIKNYLDKQKLNYIAIDVKNYSDKKLDKMLKKISINPPDFGYPAIIYIKDGTTFTNIINLKDVKFFDPADYNNGNPLNYAIIKGDILIAMSGATTGKIGYYNIEETAYLNQRVGKFIPNKTVLNSRYLYHFLLTKSDFSILSTKSVMVLQAKPIFWLSSPMDKSPL